MKNPLVDLDTFIPSTKKAEEFLDWVEKADEHGIDFCSISENVISADQLHFECH
jgi:hypothetical protein